MAIYRKGQVSLDAQGYLTGYNTKWKASLTLIRPGATIIIASNPVIYGVVSEVISDTSIRLINFGKATAAKSDYVILLHDSLTVDGLAQDVAETLRYYQGKETEFAHFIEVIKGLDYEKLEALIQRIKHESEEFEKNLAEIDKRVEQTKTYANQAQQSAHDAAARKDEVSILHTQTENLKNQAAQQVTAAAQQVALAKEEVRLAKAEVQKAEGEAVKANKEFIKAKAEATLAQEIVAGAKLEVVNEARAEVERARSEADRAQGVVDNAKQEIREEVQVQVDSATEQADRAKREADRAQDLADSFDADRVMLKSKNLSDVDDLEVARTNIKVDRLVQDANMTRVKASDGKAELRIGFDDWYVYRDSHDSEAGYIALPVKGGGTGGTTPLEAREGLELERFRQHTQRTEMATANGEYRLFVGDEGDWGVLNKQSEHVVLPVRAGGTGAKDAATARKNLGLDRVVQDSNMTRIKSQDSKTELRIGQSDWYVFRDSQDSERGYIALPVQGGGTGANDAAGARRNLQVDRFNQDSTTETRVLSADGAQAIITPNGSTWGLYRFGSGWIPLGVGQGGTGAKDVNGARANLKIDKHIQGSDRTLIQSPQVGDDRYALMVHQSGVWGCYNEKNSQYVALQLDKGGTGAKDAAGARNNIGLGTNSDVEFRFLKIKSTAANPMVIESANPMIEFRETDAPGGTKKFVMVADGGNIRMQEDNTGSGSRVFDYSSASKRITLPHISASSISVSGKVESTANFKSSTSWPALELDKTTIAAETVGRRIVIEHNDSSLNFYFSKAASNDGRYAIMMPKPTNSESRFISYEGGLAVNGTSNPSNTGNDFSTVHQGWRNIGGSCVNSPSGAAAANVYGSLFTQATQGLGVGRAKAQGVNSQWYQQRFYDTSNRIFSRVQTNAAAWGGWQQVTMSAVSDERLKDIKGNLNVEGALDNINRMEFKLFNFKEEMIQGKAKTTRRGVISQQIRMIDKEYVKNVGGYWHLDQTPMLLDGLAAIKALRARDEENKERISKLESLIEAQKAEIESLKSAVASLQIVVSQ